MEIGHRAAYLMKRSDWRYESERRVVVTPDAVEDHEGILLGKIDLKTIRYMILGPRAGAPVRDLCAERARDWGPSVLDFRIGAKTYTPFFTGADTPVAVWSGVAFEKVAEVCGRCAEPAKVGESGFCQWCNISEWASDSGPRRSALTVS